MTYVNYMDYNQARKPEFKLEKLRGDHADVWTLDVGGVTLFMQPDRLRELAAIILDKFPLVAPMPEAVQPVEDPRNEPRVDPYDHPSLISNYPAIVGNGESGLEMMARRQKEAAL